MNTKCSHAFHIFSITYILTVLSLKLVENKPIYICAAQDLLIVLSAVVFYMCTLSTLLLPWMLMETTEYLLGFGLAWPYRPQCKCMFSLSLSLSLTNNHCPLSAVSSSLTPSVVWISCLYLLLELLQLYFPLTYLCNQKLWSTSEYSEAVLF